MLFSNLSILVAATLTAFATSAMACKTGLPQCCVSKLAADAAIKKSVHDEMGVDISIGTMVWYTCDDLALVTSGGATCPGEAVCCDKISNYGAMAIGCSKV